MKTERPFFRALPLLLLAAIPGVARADIPPPDIVACWHATEGAPCCGGTRKCVLSTCTYPQYAYSGTDASVAPGPDPFPRDAAYGEAESGVDAPVGPSYPERTWYPCLSCSGLTVLTFCRDGGLPDLALPPSSDGAAGIDGVNQSDGSGGTETGGSGGTPTGGSGGTPTGGSGGSEVGGKGGTETGGSGGTQAGGNGGTQVGGSGGTQASGSSGKKHGGACSMGGWLSTRTLAPWVLAGLFALSVTVVRRRRPRSR